MKEHELHELLYQALETELGGVKVYEAALRCVKNDDLRKEWEEYQQQTKRHVELVVEVLAGFGLDTELDTPGRRVVRHIGTCLVEAMQMALTEAPEAAQLVAAECVTLAETKDHLNWELLSEVVKGGFKGDKGKILRSAIAEVEEQEDEHLYHSTGWCRELWIESLGMPAVLPPPEERKDVRTAIGAARAKQVRSEMT